MAHANSEMPYFFNPSLQMTEEAKVEAYEKTISQLNALLKEETDVVLKMVSINSILRSNFVHCYWLGFYCVKDDSLIVGPYQGTLGCLHIDFKKGVCGAVAHSKETKIVEDVHALSQGEDHIACDPNSKSEIVLPVFDYQQKLIAVFDIDSSELASFTQTDQRFLEQILATHFSSGALTQSTYI